MYYFSELRKNRKKYVGVLCELYLLLFFALLLGLLLLLLLLRAQLEINIIIKNGRNFSFLIIRMLKFFRIRMNLSIRQGETGRIALSLRKTDSDTEKAASLDYVLDIMARMAQLRKKYKQQFAYLKSKVKVNNFSVRTRIGTGDAATTALASGGSFAAFSLITLHLQKYYHLDRQKLQVVPYFQGPLFDLDLDCIIYFKIGHIMITGFKMLKQRFQ